MVNLSCTCQELDRGSGGLFGEGMSGDQNNVPFVPSELASSETNEQEEDPLPKKL